MHTNARRRLSVTFIGVEGAQVVAAALKECPRLESLKCVVHPTPTRSKSAQSNTHTCGRALAHSDSLHDNDIGDAGVIAVAAALKDVPNLKTLAYGTPLAPCPRCHGPPPA